MVHFPAEEERRPLHEHQPNSITKNNFILHCPTRDELRLEHLLQLSRGHPRFRISHRQRHCETRRVVDAVPVRARVLVEADGAKVVLDQIELVGTQSVASLEWYIG